MAVFDDTGRVVYDQYPDSVRYVVTFIGIACATAMLLQPHIFPIGTSLLPIAAAGLSWLLEWRFSINLRTRQVRMRRGLRQISAEHIHFFHDMKSFRFDFHQGGGKTAESFNLVAVFNFDGLTDFRLKTFPELRDAVAEADELHRETGIPIAESEALALRRAAFDHVGDLIEDSAKDPKQNLKA